VEKRKKIERQADRHLHRRICEHTHIS
jgi:hypothetical protein